MNRYRSSSFILHPSSFRGEGFCGFSSHCLLVRHSPGHRSDQHLVSARACARAPGERIMFTNRRQAAEARRQKDSWAKQRHQRDRRRKWQRRSIELLEDRSLLDANFNNFPAAMDTMLTALQTSLNDQVMSVNMPLIGTGLKQPPSDSQLLATFQNKFDAALNGQIPT